MPLLREICAALGTCSHGDSEHAELLAMCEVHCTVLATCHDVTLNSALFLFEDFSKAEALACAASHGLTCSGTVASVKVAVYKHVFEGACTVMLNDFSACHDVWDSLLLPHGVGVDDFQICLLSVVVPHASQHFLVHLLESKNLLYDGCVSFAKDPSAACTSSH